MVQSWLSIVTHPSFNEALCLCQNNKTSTFDFPFWRLSKQKRKKKQSFFYEFGCHAAIKWKTDRIDQTYNFNL